MEVSFLQSDSSEALLSDTRNPFDAEPSETEPLETKPPVETRKDGDTKEEETLEETEVMVDDTLNESLGQEAVFVDGVPSVSMEQDFSAPYEAYEVSMECVPNDDISSNEFSMDAPDEIPDDVLYDDTFNMEPEDESLPEIAKDPDETSAESLDIPLQGDRDEVTVNEANTLSVDGEVSQPAQEELQETEGLLPRKEQKTLSRSAYLFYLAKEHGFKVANPADSRHIPLQDYQSLPS